MIYAFLGSLFDPICGDVNHVEALSNMESMDREVALMLMQNMAANMGDPQVGVFTLFSFCLIGTDGAGCVRYHIALKLRFCVCYLC